MTSSSGVEVVSLDTTDVDRAHSTINTMYARQVPVFSGRADRFRFRLQRASAGQFSANRVTYSARAAATSEPPSSLLSFALLSGRLCTAVNGSETQYRPGDVGIAPNEVFRAVWSDVDAAFLSLPWEDVRQAAVEMAGIPPGAFRFLARTPATPALGRYWRGLIFVTSKEFFSPDSVMGDPLVQAETLRALCGAALNVFPNTALAAVEQPGPGRVEPAALRRAIDYIDANADGPVTVSDVAGAAGTSARAIQLAFAKHRSTTPMSYLRRVRLERAHHDLQAANPARGETVAAIALRWGFANTGRFADAYRKQHGVLPGHTLRA